MTISRGMLSGLNQVHRPFQPGDSSMSRCNEYWQSSWPRLGRKHKFVLILGSIIRTAGMLIVFLKGTSCELCLVDFIIMLTKKLIILKCPRRRRAPTQYIFFLHDILV